MAVAFIFSLCVMACNNQSDSQEKTTAIVTNENIDASSQLEEASIYNDENTTETQEQTELKIDDTGESSSSAIIATSATEVETEEEIFESQSDNRDIIGTVSLQ